MQISTRTCHPYCHQSPEIDKKGGSPVSTLEGGTQHSPNKPNKIDQSCHGTAEGRETESHYLTNTLYTR